MIEYKLISLIILSESLLWDAILYVNFSELIISTRE